MTKYQNDAGRMLDTFDLCRWLYTLGTLPGRAELPTCVCVCVRTITAERFELQYSASARTYIASIGRHALILVKIGQLQGWFNGQKHTFFRCFQAILLSF